MVQISTFLLVTVVLQQGVQSAEEIPREKAEGLDSPLIAMHTGEDENRVEMLELLAILEEETEIATKSKMNSDYVPGMVTVLHNEHLEALGIRTVAEALSLVPGIQMARLPSGEPSAKVRGLSYPFNAGNIKVMLNSIPLSRESSGINSSVLLTPVEQVERIEVIRGPGSSIYGDFAMAGVVNIYTKKDGGRVFARAGDDDSKSGGGHYGYYNKDKSYGMGINLSITDDGESSGVVGGDPDEKKSVGIVNFEYKDFSFVAEGVKREFEMSRVEPPKRSSPNPSPGVTRRGEREENSWAMEGRQKLFFGKAVDLEMFLSYLDNDLDAEFPQSFKGDKIEGGADAHWKITESQLLLMQFSYAQSYIDNATETGVPGAPSFEISDIDRSNYSLALQDQLTFGERFTLTLGIRYDDYDDVGDLFTPRIAGVYRLGEHHVLKAQYSEGFRAPTFWELYSRGSVNDTLDFEVLETYELSYVHRRPKAVARVTLHHSEIEDRISRGMPDALFENFASITTKGVEIEWEQQIGSLFRWQANVTYTDTSEDNSAINGESPGVAEWLGNLALYWQPLPDFMVTGLWQHVGERYSLDGGIDGYDTVDFTLTSSDLFTEGLTLRGGVKNITDEEIIYSIPRPGGLAEHTFVGRCWWVQLSYTF